MWSLSQLLTAQHNTPLAALAAALPCPSLPADVQRKAEAADARVAHAAEQQQQQQQQPSVLQCTASLTPGITAGDPDKYAECVVLRGARSDARCALELPVAASALDAALAAERQRCVRTRMLAAAPLHLPLPFPQLFQPCVSPDGDVLGPADALREPAADVASCPLLTRLSGSTAFAPTIEHARQAWSACARSAQGGSILQGWGLDADEHNEVDERLEALASAYVDEE